MNKNILIVYYTHSANTQNFAQLIAQKTGGECLELLTEVAYPREYNTVVEQAKKEIKTGFRPKLKNVVADMGKYVTVFIGTPNWWSSIAPPVATFLENYNLSGKSIIPFCTHGGGGFGNIERDIAKLCPNSKLLAGLAVYGNSCSDSQVSEWLKKNGIL